MSHFGIGIIRALCLNNRCTAVAPDQLQIHRPLRILSITFPTSTGKCTCEPLHAACRLCLIGSIMSGSPATVKQVATTFKTYCYDNRDSLMAGILVAGWDEREGGQVRYFKSHIFIVEDIFHHFLRCTLCLLEACAFDNPSRWLVRVTSQFDLPSRLCVYICKTRSSLPLRRCRIRKHLPVWPC